jgi:hypothetical protein
MNRYPNPRSPPQRNPRFEKGKKKNVTGQGLWPPAKKTVLPQSSLGLLLLDLVAPSKKRQHRH